MHPFRNLVQHFGAIVLKDKRTLNCPRLHLANSFNEPTFNFRELHLVSWSTY